MTVSQITVVVLALNSGLALMLLVMPLIQRVVRALFWAVNAVLTLTEVAVAVAIGAVPLGDTLSPIPWVAVAVVLVLLRLALLLQQI
jgi:hypothetical protein